MKNKTLLRLSGLLFTLIFISAGKEILPACDAPLVGGHTGAPGETACNGCHPGTLNSGAATFTFNLGTATYVPAQTYTGTVRINQPGIAKFGFSALALKDSNNTTIGAFNLIEAIRTRTYTDGPRKYVSHTPCGADSANSNSWIFTWTAPSTNVGNITLYAGLLASDHSHSLSGDFSYTKSLTLTPAGGVGIKETENDIRYNIYPNPVTDVLHIQFDGSAAATAYEINLFNSIGKLLYSLSGNTVNIKLNTSGLDAGVYYLKIKQNNNITGRTVIIK